MNQQSPGKSLDELAEEFLERHRSGEKPTVEEYAARYPELAGEIGATFRALLMIEEFAPGTNDSPAPGATAPTLAPLARPPAIAQLGDFRVIREVGRGGMGIVYEAEQLSLGRHVALKVLSSAAVLDPRHRQRFEREARAAARLHHTNIVPVFGVGEQAGLHYYVMQFIRGLGLDQVLDELRRIRGSGGSLEGLAAAGPLRASGAEVSAADLARTLGFMPDTFVTSLTQVADWTRSGQAGKRSTSADEPAESRCRGSDTPPPTIDGAEEHVPESFALFPPDRGRSSSSISGRMSRASYWRSIASIGAQAAGALHYAHDQGVLHRDVKPANLLLDMRGTIWIADFGLAKTGDRDLTLSGDMLGTLRYMPPEAFAGVFDCRSDVYALGLTLYELAALRPAFDERDRQKLIHEVAAGVPKRLECLEGHVPRDLATIVHKAIEREPSHRYQTAAELAADLERFLADEPVRARRVRVVERTWRWCRRNVLIASLMTLASLLAVAVAVVSTVAWLKVSRALDDSEQDRRRAIQANVEKDEQLWDTLLERARAGRTSGQPGQRFGSLRAIESALKLPLPADRSRDALRTEAIGALCLPDIEVDQEWDDFPAGSTSFAIDRSFERRACGNEAGEIEVKRVADGSLLARMKTDGRVSPYGGLVFSPDGRFLYTSSITARGATSGRCWKLDAAKPALIFEDDTARFSFHPEAPLGAAEFADGTLRILDLDSGVERRRFTVRTDASFYWLFWNPRRPRLARVSPQRLEVLDSESGARVLGVPAGGRGFEYAAWHPDGRLIAVSAAASREIVILDAETGAVVRTLEGHRSAGIIMSFNHRGDRLASNDWSGLLRLWEWQGARQLLTFPAAGTLVQFSPDDRRLAADSRPPHARLFRCRLGSEVRALAAMQYDRSYDPSNVAKISRDGRLLAVGSHDGLALIDVASNSEAARLPPAAHPLLFDSDDRALWTCGPRGLEHWPIVPDRDDPGGLRIGPPKPCWQAASPFVWWGASDDGNLFAAPASWRVLLFDMRAGRQIELTPQRDVRFCAISPDGRWVAGGGHEAGSEPAAKVWDATTGTLVASLPLPKYCAVGFSPDGRWLLTTGGRPRLWRVGSWDEGPALPHLEQSAFAFATDSSLLALSDYAKRTIRLLHPGSGREVASLSGPGGSLLSPICFSPDGSLLFTAARDAGTLFAFDLRLIRAELAPLGLDWDAPALPAPDQPAHREPIRIQVRVAADQ